MDRSFQEILFKHEAEDVATVRSEEAAMSAVREEFANAENLIFQARDRGFSLADFFSGASLPFDMELPVRRSRSFYVKKHANASRHFKTESVWSCKRGNVACSAPEKLIA